MLGNKATCNFIFCVNYVQTQRRCSPIIPFAAVSISMERLFLLVLKKTEDQQHLLRWDQKNDFQEFASRKEKTYLPNFLQLHHILLAKESCGSPFGPGI